MIKRISIYVMVLIFVFILGIVGFLTYKDQYKRPILNYCKGMQKADLKTYAKAFPDFMNVEKTQSDESMKETLDELKKMYGENIRISSKIKSAEKLNNDVFGNVEKFIEIKYKKTVQVTEAYCLKAEITVKGDKDSNIENLEMYVYRIDGNWKYMPYSPENIKKYLE